jgi:putative nucleotidyltransferase with HDIG domain
MSYHLSQSEIVERASLLPAFPTVVAEILATLDDEQASTATLAEHVQHDPVITARVVAQASSVGNAIHGTARIKDVYTAISLIGQTRTREIVITTHLADFAHSSNLASYFWEHSVAVGFAAQELIQHVTNGTDHALVAGLLHDIGQLWLARFYPLEFQQARIHITNDLRPASSIEKEIFGIDHTQIGAYIAEFWGMPRSIIDAIAQHHIPVEESLQPLVAATHVGEVLVNALDIGRRGGNQVSHISSGACHLLQIDWREDLSHLFGKIEARAATAGTFFR